MNIYKIKKIIFELNGAEYEAIPASEIEKRELSKRMKGQIDLDNCICGDEFCDGSWVWRCMNAGGGICEWYITNIVCRL